MDPLFLSYYLLLLLHPLYTRHTVPGHLTIARRPTINAYRFHAHRDKYGVARGTECRRAPLVPGTNTIFKAPSGENMWWMLRDMYFFFFQSDLISTNARSTTIRRYREDRRKEEGKGGRERKKTKAYRVTGSLSGGEIPPPWKASIPSYPEIPILRLSISKFPSGGSIPR